MSDETAPKFGGPPVGKELTDRIGKYAIQRLLGSGGMGVVYVARDTLLERDVALKVMAAQLADNPRVRKRFEREAKAVARMTHPNVVTVFDLGYHVDGSPYIAMELLKGMDLRHAIRSQPPMSLERKISVVLQILAGLSHAHRASIVHRDVKPANVFLGMDGTVKIMDFGVARLTTASLTGPETMVGTAPYMSPEQVKGDPVDGRSDIFSVGCILYELVTGRRAFDADDLVAVFYRITHDEPDIDVIPEAGEFEGLRPIVRTALAKNLDQRYQTAYDFAVALRDYFRPHATTPSAKHALDHMLHLEPPAAESPRPFADPDEPTIAMEDRSARDEPRVPPAYPTLQDAAGSTLRPLVSTAVDVPHAVLADAARPSSPTEPPGRFAAIVDRTAEATAPAGAGISKVQPRRWRPVLAALAVLLSAAAVAVALLFPPPKPKLPDVQSSTGPSTSEDQRSGVDPLRAAQSALESGQYEEAARQAQAALREHPGSSEALEVINKAIAGQEATRHFRSAALALQRDDLATAAAETEAGRSLAPWDDRGRELLEKIRAKREAEKQRRARPAAEIDDLLARADGKLQERQYAEAIDLYGQVIALDPGNDRARKGKSTALRLDSAGPVPSPSLPSPPPAGKAFVADKTVAQAPTDSWPGPGPRRSQDPALPGKIEFDLEPKRVKPGDKYAVTVYMRNDGSAPIQIQSVRVALSINGRKSGDLVASQVKELAPGQKAPLFSDAHIWQEDTTSWSMEVVVETARKGESYRNHVTWQ
jgi:serine/threonine protein kinase